MDWFAGRLATEVLSGHKARHTPGRFQVREGYQRGGRRGMRVPSGITAGNPNARGMPDSSYAPGVLRGTSTSRLNSATSVPSWL